MGKILHVFSWGGECFKSMSISGDLTPTPPKKIAPLAFFPPTVSWERSYMYFLEGENASNPWVFQEIWPLPPLKKLHLSPFFHQPSHGKDPKCIFLRGRTLQIHEYFRRSDPYPPKKITPLAFFPPTVSTVSWKRSYMYFLEGGNASNPWVFQEIWPLLPLKKLDLSPSSTNRLMWKILHVFSWGGERFKSMSISGDLTPTPPKKITSLAFFPPTVSTVSWKRSHMYFVEGGDSSNWLVRLSNNTDG